MKLFNNVRSLLPTFILLGLVFGMLACSGGGGGGTPTPPANANPVGYYAGTLSVTSPAQPNLSAKAIVDSDKFLMVHVDLGAPDTLLYKGTFTNITVTTFTADVRIYRNGVFLRTATISNGSITEKGSLGGTLSGTDDYTATSFSLTYDTTINSRVAPTITTNETWVEKTTNLAGFSFSNNGADLGDGYGVSANVIPTELENCGSGTTTLTNVTNSEVVGRVRKYAAIYPTSCANITTAIPMQGYITPFDSAGGSNDDRYLWIVFNDTIFYAAELAI